MGTNVFPHIYDKLVDEDIKWLKENTSNDGLYFHHIVTILEKSKADYREFGCAKAMNERIG